MSDSTPPLKEELAHVDKKVREALQEAGDLPMYHMLRYFMGYENDLRKPSDGMHGKRTRSTLLLLVANMFGDSPAALDLAAAIELFHNFTLVHDDIEDHDELRRGQPTVWKLWGVNHGINAGDAQLILVNRCLLRAAEKDPKSGAAAARLLNDYFLEVIEGQYLDFELTEKSLDDSFVTEQIYTEMIRKKTAVLIGAATAAGGQAAGCDKKTVGQLFSYGEALGLAYQITDDMVSVWGDVEKTGKRAHGDIVERKKTYPVLYVRDHGDKKRLLELYAKESDLTISEVQEVIAPLDAAGARKATMDLINTHVNKARVAVSDLPLDEKLKQALTDLVEKISESAGVVPQNKQ